jgi:hypothetical protein
MQAINVIREGFRLAGRHKRLAVVLWLAPLVPAVVLAAMAASNLAPQLGRSLFADGVLDGNWFIVMMEFRQSPADALDPILYRGVVVLGLLTMLVQVLLSGGIVETLLERRPSNPFVIGVRRHFLRFFRTSMLLASLTVVVVVLSRIVSKAFFKIAESQADGRFDLVGIGLAALLFVILWAPLDLAADVSRISAARHDHRSMVGGFFKALRSVLGRPGLFVPIYLVFLALPVLVMAVYNLVRAPITAGSVVMIAGVFLLQQVVMLIRAWFKLGLWGAEVAAFRQLGEPPWCQGRPAAKTIEETSESALEAAPAQAHEG